jgi:hypothetical protein
MITKIHPFDMFQKLHELPAVKMADVTRDAFGTITVDGELYDQTTEVDPTEAGLAYLAVREPEIAALYKSGMVTTAEVVEVPAEPVETVEEDPIITEPSGEEVEEERNA